jgi:hypothetical protein
VTRTKIRPTACRLVVIRCVGQVPIGAPNRATALAKALDEFGVSSPRERQRIIVQRMSDHN